jgi:CubicO group peptidase (beta-lactamase class C family)
MLATTESTNIRTLMIRRLLLVLMAMAAAPACAQWTVTGDPVPQLVAFDSAMQTLMTQHGATAGQLAVTWQGRLVLAHGYTLNPIAGDITVQPGSLMRVASNSKQITSILINRLIQEGRLSLTSTVGNFINLSTLPGHTADPRLANVTVRNLLEHLAGFRTYDGLRDPMFADPQIAADVGIGLPIGTADIIRAMNGIALGSQPGTTFSYSNYGYMLLGRIIEDVTGMSYEDYAKSVFAPIGVRNLRLGHSLLSQRAPNEVGYKSGIMRATVMDNSGVQVPYEYGAFNIENMDSHGGWILSAVELVRIASNLDNPSGPDAVLNQTSINRMFSLPQNYPLPYHSGDAYYAHGWSVRNYGNGNYNTWHDGSLPGTTSYMARIQDGWDFVAILNRRDETGTTCVSCEIDNAMWGVRNQIVNWPSGDLFPKMLSVIFTNGFD